MFFFFFFAASICDHESPCIPQRWPLKLLSRKPLHPYWTIPCFWCFLATSRHLSSFQIGWLILQSSGILEVSKYSVIMLDEAHERTPDICIQTATITIRRTASWWRDKVFKQALHGLISWPSDFPLAETKPGVHQMALMLAVFHSCEDDLHRCSVRIAEGCSEARYSDSGMLNALHCDLTWPTYPRKRPELKLIVTSANFSEGSVWRFSRDCTDLELRQPWMLRNSPVGLAFLRGLRVAEYRNPMPTKHEWSSTSHQISELWLLISWPAYFFNSHIFTIPGRRVLIELNRRETDFVCFCWMDSALPRRTFPVEILYSKDLCSGMQYEHTFYVQLAQEMCWNHLFDLLPIRKLLDVSKFGTPTKPRVFHRK